MSQLPPRICPKCKHENEISRKRCAGCNVSLSYGAHANDSEAKVIWLTVAVLSVSAAAAVLLFAM